jgi:hypothetical protein
MRTIYKYGVELTDYFSIDMPTDAEILCCQIQFEKPFIWAMVNSENKLNERNFRVIGTGHLIEEKEKLQYIDTFQINGGQLIFHLFEVI